MNPPPPSLAASILLVRAALVKTLGLDLTKSVTAASPQALWLKTTSSTTTKVQFNVGKKDGDLLSVKPPPNSDKEAQTAYILAIEKAVNAMISEFASLSISVTEQSIASVTDAYGKYAPYDGKTDGSERKAAEKKWKPTKKVKGEEIANPPLPPAPTHCNIVSAEGVFFGAIADGWSVCNTVGGIEGIEFLKVGSKGGCEVNIGAKGTTITLMWQVNGNNADSGDVASVTKTAETVDMKWMEGGVDNLNAIGQEMYKQQVASNEALLSKLEEMKVSDNKEGGDKNEEEEEMVVNAWEVSGKIDYDKLIDKFGSSAIDQTLLDRLEKAIQKIGKVKTVHRFLRRGIFFSHRDLHAILDCVESDKPFYLYTGRGPSSESMHLGHLIPFMMTQWLQEAFDVPLVVQMTDDEKFLWKGEYKDGDDNLSHFQNLAVQNAKDIIACGFDREKTFIFTDTGYIQHMYPNIVRVQKSVTLSTAKGIFGFENSSNIGQCAFPAIQAVPSFPSTFMIPLKCGRDSEMACLIPCAIDQDPYFRMTRDVAHKLSPPSHPLKGKPALLHSKFFPPLQGATGKMSASDDNSAIFLTDSDKRISDKIKQHAFSGGQDTKKKQEELGANLDVDVSYQWLTFFLESDSLLSDIGSSYSSGSGEFWSTGLVKSKLIEVLVDLVGAHRKRRDQITNDEVKEWMAVRELKF